MTGQAVLWGLWIAATVVAIVAGWAVMLTPELVARARVLGGACLVVGSASCIVWVICFSKALGG